MLVLQQIDKGRSFREYSWGKCQERTQTSKDRGEVQPLGQRQLSVLSPGVKHGQLSVNDNKRGQSGTVLFATHAPLSHELPLVELNQ